MYLFVFVLIYLMCLYNKYLYFRCRQSTETRDGGFYKHWSLHIWSCYSFQNITKPHTGV